MVIDRIFENCYKEANHDKFWELLFLYRLPDSAYTDFESLKHFSESLIAANRTGLLGGIYGRAIAGKDAIFPHESIRELLEQFDNDELDLQVCVAYINNQGARLITDGNDQMQKAAKFTTDAQTLSIRDTPHNCAEGRSVIPAL